MGDTTKADPVHVGIIMDGNGRWAEKRNQIRTSGHREGLTAAKNIVAAAADRGIQYLTLYIFSTENWKRSRSEVSFLMKLIAEHLAKEYDFYREKGIRIVHSGNIEGLPKYVQREIARVIKSTSGFRGLTLNMAVNYGGRDEIIRSLHRCLQTGEAVTEEALAAHLDVPEIPDPDLIIRTAGEMRLSNFLLWQSAYSELYVCDKLWPDWRAEDLDRALEAYRHRGRRFGGLA